MGKETIIFKNKIVDQSKQRFFKTMALHLYETLQLEFDTFF